MIPLESWPDRLDAALADRRHLRRATVVRETESTQDAARRQHASTGEIVVAWRQTAGRGRLGRRWLDTGEDGVACSFVLPRREPARLTALVAVTVCRALERLGASRAPGAKLELGIKWPNDIVSSDGAKLCGILVECADDLAIVGIGVNVRQRAFPELESLSREPVSLAMLGVEVDRIEVIESLVRSLDEALDEPGECIDEAYRRRDHLRGRVARFESAGRIVEGLVLQVDPERGIHLLSEGRERILPGAITLLAVAPGGRRPT